MFRGIRDKIKLYKLNRRDKKLDAEWKRVIKEAQEKKNRSILDEWERTVFLHEYEYIDWENG